MCIFCWKLQRFVFVFPLLYFLSSLYCRLVNVQTNGHWPSSSLRFFLVHIFLKVCSYIYLSFIYSFMFDAVVLISVYSAHEGHCSFSIWFGGSSDFSSCVDPNFWASYLKVEAIIGRNDEAIMNFEKVNWTSTDLQEPVMDLVVK